MKMTLNFKMFLKVDFIFISGGTTFASLKFPASNPC